MEQIAELRRQLRGDILFTRRPLSGARAGQFRVRMRGSGSDFDQLRDYQPGDDIRSIDWKSSARVQKVVVRDYREERSRMVRVVCDLSRSMDFGMAGCSAYKTAEQLAVSLAILCENAGDGCGLFFAGSSINSLGMPVVGSRQTDRIKRAFIEAPRTEKSVEFSTWCRDLGRFNLPSSLIFFITDLVAEQGASTGWIRSLAGRHHLFVIRVRDESELFPQLVGDRWLLKDSEQIDYLRFGLSHDFTGAQRALAMWRKGQLEMLRRLGVGCIDCFSHLPVVSQLRAGLRRYGMLADKK